MSLNPESAWEKRYELENISSFFLLILGFDAVYFVFGGFWTLKVHEERDISLRSFFIMDFGFWRGFFCFWRLWICLIRFLRCCLGVLDKKKKKWVENRFLEEKTSNPTFPVFFLLLTTFIYLHKYLSIYLITYLHEIFYLYF